MNALELPEQLKGPWDHAMILSYGLNIPFFERSLWHQFAARCRNKIILADGQQYLQASKDYAQQKGLVHHMNQLYVVAGIFGSHAYTSVHAKLILLTNAQQGRLLVGSGNLHWQGYASGGELFTTYEYSLDAPESLPAFLAVRELVDALIQRGSIIGITAHRRIEYMWEQTPWLFHTPANVERPVRHNLTSSFLDQLLITVSGEPVEELWVLSPFYDKNAIALERLLKDFQPDQTTILVQLGWTSVDPAALQQVIDRAPGRCEIRAFQRGNESTYVHAKCYLLKLKERAICLQGSPNLSQVAMLLASPYSNVEVANLLTGPRNAFDYVFEALHIEPATTDLTTLKLDLQATGEPEEAVHETWGITGGEWYGKHLLLNFQGTLPSFKGLTLVIGESMFPLTVSKLEFQSHVLELVVPEKAQVLLAQPLPIVIQWEDGESIRQTNPIFVCNRAALDAALQYSVEHELLNHVGYLDLDDKELEELLGELNETLIIDQRSVWQLAGRTLPTHTPNEEASEHISYDDIDYDRLRQHPKFQQYMHSSTGSQGYTRSRLQIILNAITAHFQTLGEGATITAYMHTISAQLEESEDTAEEEIPPAIEERQQWHRTTQQRIGRLLKNFIQRYLLGLRSTSFQAFAGYEMVTQNYVIFTHVLWRLFAKDWVEETFVIDALVQSWNFFWGDGAQAGYWYLLDAEQQAHALQLIADYHNDANMLAALFYSAKVASAKGEEKQLFALRAFWRKILCQPPFPLKAQAMAETQQMLAHLLPYDAPSATAIVNGLAQLARFDTRANFLHQLEVPGRYAPGSCAMEKHSVVRHRGQAVMVNCLVVRAPGALADRDDAISLLQEWMEAESLDYYRITTTGFNDAVSKTRLIFYDVAEQRGKYWNRDQGGKALDFETIPLPTREWDANIVQLQALAAQLV